MLNKVIDKFELASKVELDGKHDYKTIESIVGLGNLKMIASRAGVNTSALIFSLIEVLNDMPSISNDELDDLFA